MRTTLPFLLVLAVLTLGTAASVSPYLWVKGVKFVGIISEYPYLDIVWLSSARLLVLGGTIGGQRPGARIPATIAGIAALLTPVIWFGEWPGYWYLLCGSLAEACVICVGLGILRVFGVSIRIECTSDAADGTHRSITRMAWSLRDILALVAAMAALLAAMRHFRPAAVSFRQLCFCTIDAAGAALLIGAAVTFGLGNARMRYRLAIFAVAILGAYSASELIWGLASSQRHFAYGIDWWTSLRYGIQFQSEQGIPIAVLLWIFRPFGYRMIVTASGSRRVQETSQ